MLFQSQAFVLLFLPPVLALYWLAARHEGLRQWILILASLVFYGWWDVRFLPLLVAHAVLSWLFAGRFGATGRKLHLYLAIGLNLLSLGVFKYTDFLIANMGTVAGIELPPSGIILPIGISFFTFQLVSYLIDLERGTAPLYPFRGFFLFATFFPQLIAGPIVRHNQIIGQLALSPWRPGAGHRFAAGLVLFTLGFAKKVLLADRLARLVDPVFARAGDGWLSFGEAWTGALGFTFQLFLDFSAYSEMAIGLGLLFGLTLPENFNRPYLATSLRDFWRRWHITLSLFLRDYLFIPLGGSHFGLRVYVLASMVTMGLAGLWHGAGWTFIVWGLMHGAGLVACHVWQRAGRRLPTPLAWSLTMLFVVVGWVVFRAPDLPAAGRMLVAAAGGNGLDGTLEGAGLMLAAAAVALAVPSAHTIIERTLAPRRLVAAASALLLAVCVLEVGNAPPAAFIYFQF